MSLDASEQPAAPRPVRLPDLPPDDLRRSVGARW